MKKYLNLLLLSTFLVGCAVTPKPPMPEGMYGKAAMDSHGLDRCGFSGRMGLDVVARGKTIISNGINQYTFDRERMGKEFQAWQQSLQEPPDAWCSNFIVLILQNQQQAEARQRDATAVAPSWMRKPSVTNCSTYFGQTHCTSF